MDRFLKKLYFVFVPVMFVTPLVAVQVAGDNAVAPRSRIVALLDKIGECAERRDSHVFVDVMDAVQALASLPSADVAAVAFQRIQSDPRFQEGSARSRAYGQLSRSGAREIPEVRQQLLRGLTEQNNSIISTCAEGLSHAEGGVRRIAIEKLVSQGGFSVESLDGDSNEVTERLERLTEIIKCLNHYGPEAKDYLERAEAIFHNKELIELRKKEPKLKRFRQTPLAHAVDTLRGAAARALVQIGGIERAIEKFQKIDPESDPRGDLMATGALANS